jgi:hypothetical protein
MENVFAPCIATLQLDDAATARQANLLATTLTVCSGFCYRACGWIGDEA